jgi:hypothetical protein
MSQMTLHIRCRQIGTADIDGVVKLLTTGFRVRSRNFWVRAFKRLTEHSTPQGFPKYGYLLECNEIPVGVIILIFSRIALNGETRIRCSVSSWYVEPPFRSYATLLTAHALRHKHVTYFNITPRPDTLPILEAQGYVRYCLGRYVTVPALSPWSHGSHVKVVTCDISPGQGLQSSEIELLLAHSNYGCISLICSSSGIRHPFVFLPLRKAGLLHFLFLVYCRHLEDFVRFAGQLGRFLACRGFPLVVVDSNGPIDGLVGRYSERTPRYFKGPDQPRLGDWAYSERVMFGI